MPKRKRTITKPSVTAGPLDDSTGQRSVFPQTVLASTRRDNEWEYDEGGEEKDPAEDDEIVGPSFIEDGAIYEEMEEDSAAASDLSGEDQDAQYLYDEASGHEWQEEPQTEAIAYLQSVRMEAESLPTLTYVDHLIPSGGPERIPKDADTRAKDTVPTQHNEQWKTQFLGYYVSLRETLANVPVPNFSQEELDSLLHINPNRRPTKSSEEDGLWRVKTIDRPSLPLLSMLDHPRIIHLLTHLRKKMSANIKENQCMWLVFLLAKLGDLGVLNGDEVDLLRRIGRKCLTVRPSLAEGEGKVVLSTIDFIICIIRDFYQQRDLEEGF